MAPCPRAASAQRRLVVLVDCLALVAQLAHGEELDDPRLDVGEPVVVLVEDLLGRGEVDGVVAAHAPRQLEHAVQPGADPALLGRLRAGALEAVDLLGDEVVGRLRDVERVEPGAVLADDVAVVLAQLLADRGQLLAQQVLALLAVDALGDVVADRLGDLQLGEVLAGPRQDELDAVGHRDRGQHLAPAVLVEVGPRDDPVGERARLRRRAEQLGQPARAAQLGDRLEHDAQLAAEGLDAGRRPGVADDLDVGVGRPALGRVDGGDAGPRLDAHDRHRLPGRKGADVGHLGDDAERAVVGAQHDPPVGRGAPGLDRPAQLVAAEGEGDHRAGQHGGGKVGQREADEGAGGGVGGEVGGGSAITHVSKDID